MASIFILVTTPPLAENPPGLPSAASTRWQGTTIGQGLRPSAWPTSRDSSTPPSRRRSEEHTSELQSRQYLGCRLLLEKKTSISVPKTYASRNCQNIRTHGAT